VPPEIRINVHIVFYARCKYIKHKGRINEVADPNTFYVDIKLFKIKIK
jgi:hypothetical protein